MHISGSEKPYGEFPWASNASCCWRQNFVTTDKLYHIFSFCVISAVKNKLIIIFLCKYIFSFTTLDWIDFRQCKIIDWLMISDVPYYKLLNVIFHPASSGGEHLKDSLLRSKVGLSEKVKLDRCISSIDRARWSKERLQWSNLGLLSIE